MRASNERNTNGDEDKRAHEDTWQPSKPATQLPHFKRIAHPHAGDERAAHALAVMRGAGRDAAQVAERLRERRDAAETLHVALAGVVRGERDALVTKTVDQVAKVLRPCGDVVRRIEQ